MADRRMTSKNVVYDDKFLEMPLATQGLYFHMILNADDDGFLRNPKAVARVVGASPDDLKLLIAKQWLIPFESGVVVIKHWRLHNTLRKDRYKPTACIERSLVNIDESGIYQLITDGEPTGNQLATTWQPNGNQLATQYRLGKGSIGKGSVIEESREESALSADAKKLFTTYREKIHPVSGGIEGDKLVSLLDDYGLDLCLKAIDRAVLRKKRSIRYISGILKSWQQDGYDEPEDNSDDGRYVKLSENPSEEINNIPF